jgi:hypothetical protein
VGTDFGDSPKCKRFWFSKLIGSADKKKFKISKNGILVQNTYFDMVSIPTGGTSGIPLGFIGHVVPSDSQLTCLFLGGCLEQTYRLCNITGMKLGTHAFVAQLWRVLIVGLTINFYLLGLVGIADVYLGILIRTCLHWRV